MTTPTRRSVIAVDNRADDVRATFAYDPTAVGVIRGVRGRRWHPAETTWTVPHQALDDVCARCRAAGFDVEVARPEPAEMAPEMASTSLLHDDATMCAAILVAVSVYCEFCGATDVATWVNDPWRLRVHCPGVEYRGAISPGGDRCYGHDRFVTELRNAGFAMVGPSRDGGRRRLPSSDDTLTEAGLSVAALCEAGWVA